MPEPPPPPPPAPAHNASDPATSQSLLFRRSSTADGPRPAPSAMSEPPPSPLPPVQNAGDPARSHMLLFRRSSTAATPDPPLPPPPAQNYGDLESSESYLFRRSAGGGPRPRPMLVVDDPPRSSQETMSSCTADRGKLPMTMTVHSFITDRDIPSSSNQSGYRDEESSCGERDTEIEIEVTRDSSPPPTNPALPFWAFKERKCGYILVLLGYIGLGVIGYCIFKSKSPSSFAGAAPGNTTVTDGSYFIITTLTTIGYGDVHPVTSFAHLTVCVYILIGLPLVSIISVVISRAFNDWEDTWLDNFVKNYGSVEVDDKRPKRVTMLTRFKAIIVAPFRFLWDAVCAVYKKLSSMSFFVAFNAAVELFNLSVFRRIGEEHIPRDRLGEVRQWFVAKKECLCQSIAGVISKLADLWYNPPKNCCTRILACFAKFIKESDRSEIKILLTALVSILLTCVSALVSNFYLAIMSTTTVGYGDESFMSPSGRRFAAAWLFPAFLMYGRFLSIVGDYFGSPEPRIPH